MNPLASLDVFGWQRLCCAALLVLTALPGASAQTPPAVRWDLVWSDEFNAPAGTLPNQDNWAYDTGGGGWGNNELEVYCAPFTAALPCDRRQPNAVHDGQGRLVIRAFKHNGVWTSARLKTAGKHQFQYGRMEARLKLQPAAGFWPAFWMLGSNIGSVGWPRAGEQDIMEWVQSYRAQATSSTLHGPGYSGGHSIGKSVPLAAGGRIDDVAFHTYGVVWSKDLLQFYRDDPARPFFTLTPASLPRGALWVYNHPFFLLLNFAIGSGGFAGATDASTPATGNMLVDYVRVYKVHAAGPPSSTSMR